MPLFEFVIHAGHTAWGMYVYKIISVFLQMIFTCETTLLCALSFHLVNLFSLASDSLFWITSPKVSIKSLHLPILTAVILHLPLVGTK